MSKVDIKNVDKFYGDVHAVKNLSLMCDDKEFMAILGPSGCGKSSTLRMLAGLEEVSSGEIYFDDRAVTDFHPSKRNIGLAFENYALYPHLSVYDNIVFPLLAKGQSLEEIKKNARIEDLLKRFGLDTPELLNAYPKNLSGGQAQLVSLVRCLVREADLYLLDEPLSHLDEEMRVKMRTILKMMHKKMKKSFIYVTHDQLEAFALVDRIAIMNFGKLQQVGTPEEIYGRPVNKFVASFIGEPPMNFLSVTTRIDGNGGRLIGRGFELKLPERFQGKVKDQQNFSLGIRSENVQVCKEEDPGGVCIQAQVMVFEPLGEVNQVTGEVGHEIVITETDPGFLVEMDETVYFKFDLSKIHLFDSETEQAVY